MQVNLYFVSIEDENLGEIIKPVDNRYKIYEKREKYLCYAVKSYRFAVRVSRLVKKGALTDARDVANQSIDKYF